MTDEIVNKVARSGLITLNLEEMFPKGDIGEIDIKDQLWQGLVLREKDFRDFIKNHNWDQYEGKFVAVTCSVDAIIPHWAYMLIASALSGKAKKIVFGTRNSLEEFLIMEVIAELNAEDFRDQRIIIKGCSDRDFSANVYMQLVNKLQPVAKSIMFGEPCSTVPVFKRS